MYDACKLSALLVLLTIQSYLCRFSMQSSLSKLCWCLQTPALGKPSRSLAISKRRGHSTLIFQSKFSPVVGFSELSSLRVGELRARRKPGRPFPVEVHRISRWNPWARGRVSKLEERPNEPLGKEKPQGNPFRLYETPIPTALAQSTQRGWYQRGVSPQAER